MADEEGPQAPPVPQGAHDPLAPQNPPPPQNPQIPLVPNAPQAPPPLALNICYYHQDLHQWQLHPDLHLRLWHPPHAIIKLVSFQT